MKEITINGVGYLPASALAKQFRYTTDYIGQLCRAKKVDAQLVGRSWYINPLSLEAHKKTRYSKSEQPENISEISHEVSLSRVDVESVASKNTVKLSKTHNNFAKRMDWRPLKYEVDSNDLLPNINHDSVQTKVPIDLAESSELTVKNGSKTTNMVAEPLPLVSLKGKLKVSSIKDTEFNVDSDSIPTDIPLPPVPLPQTTQSRSLHLTLPKHKEFKHVNRAFSTVPVSSDDFEAKFVPSFTPTSILNSNNLETEEESPEVLEMTLVVTSGVLVLCLILVFFGESSVSASAGSYHSGIDFSAQSLSALVSYFSY